MDKNLQSKVTSIVAEINEIARELDDISHELGREFKGIGSTKSAASLQQAASKYRNVTHELRKI
jgi:uncharacterized protein YicC (UPF0701 family)